MGNQPRTADNVTVVSTSTRNFPNRKRAGANVFLASAELSSVCSVLGRIPSFEEYMGYMNSLEAQAEDTFRYMNFDQAPEFVEKAERAALTK